MIRKIWVLVIASVLVSVILIEGQVFAAGKKIVVFFDGISSQVQQDTVAAVGLIVGGITVVHTLSFINALAIVILNPNQVNNAVTLLQSYTALVKGVHDDLVVSVNPIIPAPTQEIPSTETYPWGLQYIRVDVAHQEMPGWNGQGVKVAIVDTGVGNLPVGVGGCWHPDLLIVDGFNALPGGGSFCDNHGHGTHNAGIIAAEQNDLVIKGAAPQASIVPVKVLDSNGKGHLSDLINGLQWLYNNPQIRLVNMSLGFSTASPPLNDATQKVANNGTIMVASAGNKCSDNGGSSESGGAEGEEPTCVYQSSTFSAIKYPAQYDWVLAVTAIDIGNLITAYSPIGGQLDIAAPGGVMTNTPQNTAILSTCSPPSYCPSGYGYGSGTSPAAAHVTGALALKLQQNSQISLSAVQDLLQKEARKRLVSPGTQIFYPKDKQGWGLIDVKCLLDPTSSQCPPN